MKYKIESLASEIAERLGRNSRLIRMLRPVYEYILDFITMKKGINWRINEINYKILPYYRHYFNHTHEPQVAQFLKNRIRPGDVIFDIGANVGQYVLQLGKWSEPSGSIVAFEPSRIAATILKKHIAINDLTDRVRIVEAAVSDTDGSATLYSSGPSSMNRLQSPDVRVIDISRPDTVAVVSLDFFCEQEGIIPNWILIDIEGFEIKALYGAQRLLSRHRGEIGVVVEFHPYHWDAVGTKAQHAKELFDNIGVVPIPLTGQADIWSEYGLVFLSPSFSNSDRVVENEC